MTNFNTSPYFDDFDEQKKFLRVLFRPGYAVQTRELNQAQSILQNQVARFGQSIYEEGSVVVPGQMTILRRDSIKVNPVIQRIETISGTEGTPTDISAADTPAAARLMLNKTGTGFGVSGGSDATLLNTKALLRAWQPRDTSVSPEIPQGFVVEYTRSADNNTKSLFSAEERVRVKISETDADNFVEYQITLRPSNENPNATASFAEVQRGIYFLRNHFVLVESQVAIINAYNTTTPASVGFTVAETFVTPEEDNSLNDNANGTFNFSAPGAHRYKIEATLVSKQITVTTDSDGNEVYVPDTSDADYIETMQFTNGVMQEHKVVANYSQLEKALARRTFDESGNYSVNPFRVQVKEKRSNNRGAWTEGRFYLIGDIVTDGGFTYRAMQSGTAGPSRPSVAVGTGVADAADGSLESNVVWSYEKYPQYNGGDTADLGQTEAQALDQEGKLTVIVEPGKAYIKGYEIEKTAPGRIDITKARDALLEENDSIGSVMGNYVVVSAPEAVLDIAALEQVTLYDQFQTALLSVAGSSVGTARIRGLEFINNEYRLYLFDVKMNSGKSFVSNVKGIKGGSGYANIVNQRSFDNQGSITIANADEVTGVGTRFSTAFVVGDYIEVEGTTRRITAITDDTTMAVSSGSNYTGGVAYRKVESRIHLPNSKTVMYPMFVEAVKTVKTEAGGSQVEYTVMQRFNNSSDGSGTVEFARTSAVASSGTGTRFSTSVEENEIILVEAGGSLVQIGTGGVAIDRSNSDTDKITITGLSNSTSYVAMIPVIKESATDSREKTKTLQTGQIDIVDLDALANRRISLSKADVYRVVRVSMSSVASGGTYDASGEIDITDWFDLDDGQREAFYDHARLIRKPEYSAPTGYIRIDYEYFSHGNTGDYFSIDSYPVRDEDIPYYQSISGPIPLRNVLDFRPVLNDAGTGFTGTGGSLSLPPKPGTELTATYQYYTSRIDKIAIGLRGNVFDLRGTPSLNPQIPQGDPEAMDIAQLDIPAYTFSPKDINIKRIDNRRYTMRDIGTLESRIDRLEYYTSLNLLEQQAAALEVPDDDDPRLTRFKNGFVVDNFAGHRTGDTRARDYRAAIDMEANELRPTFHVENTELVESVSTDAERTAAGYQVTGEVLTLPYTEETFIEQPFATTTENVNPYAIFTFVGSVSLNPFADQWFETNRLPDIVNDVEGNFNATRDRLAQEGVLGNVWNAWQTQWSGVRNIGGRRTTGGGEGTWRQTWQDWEEQSDQTRTGINTEVVATFSRELVEADREVSRSVIPFIRSREVVFVGRGLKLQSNLYPYFDGVPITEHVTPASRIQYGPEVDGGESGVFDWQTQAGGDADQIARRFNPLTGVQGTPQGNTQPALNKGDVIFVAKRGTTTYATPEASPCTAVCVLQEVQPGGVNRTALVINHSGNFQVGDIIEGSISGNRGKVTLWSAKTKGDQLTTNFGGDVAGVFEIPNTPQIQFRTGTREFKLIDNETNNDRTAMTRGSVNYEANGILRDIQSTFNSVRNGQIVQTEINDEQTVTLDSGTDLISSVWVPRRNDDFGTRFGGGGDSSDPIAQTFFVEEEVGCFLTSIDIYLASVDPEVPLRLQVRNTVNGYPGPVVLPFGEVILDPYQIRDDNRLRYGTGFGLSSNTTDLSALDSSPIDLALSPDTPTRFTFESPVFVQSAQEYCIVLLSDSNNYHAWISNLGEFDVLTDVQVHKQPYLGSFFKSQNNRTWTPAQNQDLKFRINKAQFSNLSNTITGPDGRKESVNTRSLNPGGTATFHNARLDLHDLEDDPLQTRFGSKYVRVFHRNHGFTKENSKVTLSGFVAGTFAGINATELNKTHDIVHVGHDSYVIKVTSSANETTRVGGSNIQATRNVLFDGMQPVAPRFNFFETRIDFIAKTLSGQSVFGGETPYVRDTVGIEVLENENNFFTTPKLLASEDNEVVVNGDKVKSLDLDVRLFSTNANLSPVLELTRMSLTTFNNRVSNPTITNSPYLPTEAEEQQSDGTVFDKYGIVSADTTNIVLVSNDSKQITTANNSIRGKFQDLIVGQVIELSNCQNASNNGQCIVTAVEPDGSIVTTDKNFVAESPAGAAGGINIVGYNNYIDEISPNQGTTAAKYMTRRINLSDAAGNSTAMTIRFAANVPTGANIDVYRKTKLSSDPQNFDTVNWTLVGTVGSTNASGFSEKEFRVTGIDSFDQMAVKLVMRSSSCALVPRAKDLIVVANA